MRFFAKFFALSLLCLLCCTGVGAEEYLFQLGEGAEVDAALLDAAEPIHTAEGIYKTDDPALLSELQELGVVRCCGTNDTISLFDLGERTSALKSEEWSFAMLGADYAAEHGVTGSGVTVAVIDSGLSDKFALHTGATLLDGVNYLVDEKSSERGLVTDTVGHGTFVSSLIAGDGCGFAPSVTLLPLKCFDAKSSAVEYVVPAIYDAIAAGCDVINMSFGTVQNNELLQTAVEKAVESGVIVIAACGNLKVSQSSGNDPLMYPAAYDGVIGVGAVAENQTVASFSSQNSSVSIAAPGVSVLGINANGKFTRSNGTSYATPIVTAAAALALSCRDNVTAAEFSAALFETARDLGTAGYDYQFGYGLIDIGLLLATLRGDTDGLAFSYYGKALRFSALLPQQCAAPCRLLCAFYDASGRLLTTQTFLSDGGSLVFRSAALPEKAASVKLLSLSEVFVPLCAARCG